MSDRRLFHIVCGAVMLGLVATASIGAATPRRTTPLTFTKAVHVPGATLAAGSYTFELANPESSADVVRIMGTDRSHLYWSGFTRRVERPAGMKPNQLITFGEAPANAPPPIAAWYFENERIGRQFIY